MASLDRDVEMTNCNYSSSPELSSLPSDSPSEPGSPTRMDQRQANIGHKNDEIIVDSSSTPRYSLQHLQPQPKLPFSATESVTLTKKGQPRKKPGRKPGTGVKPATDSAASSPAAATAAATVVAVMPGTEAPKAKRQRKPRDPNAPPVQRKKRATASLPAAPETDTQRSLSSAQFQPKIELTSMRMDLDTPRMVSSSSVPTAPVRTPPLTQAQPSRQPLRQHVREPPLERIQKRETKPSSMQSILNPDDSPILSKVPAVSAPTAITPGRSSQKHEPARFSYDPVRETIISRDPYGTTALASPRGVSQLSNRASESPSIASLIDPPAAIGSPTAVAAPSTHHHISPPPFNSPSATIPVVSTASSHYHDNTPSLPPSPSPSPAVRSNIPSTSSHRSQAQQPPSSLKPPPPAPRIKASTQSSLALETAANPVSTSSLAQTNEPSVLSSTTPIPISAKPTSTLAKSAASKNDANGQKLHSRAPPPPPPVPTIAKSSSAKSTAAKASVSKSSTSKAAAAAAAATTKPATEQGVTDTRDKGTSANGTTLLAKSESSTPHIKKFSSILQQERGSKQNKTSASAASSPRMSGVKDNATPQSIVTDSLSLSGNASTNGEPERSILDFGKARPGEEMQAPSIILHIPLVQGESNKYVNFMRMAEDRYGWDALHPRLAAHRDRKARIAAASAALERNWSGRESGDEMTDDMQSGDEGSNDENGVIGENRINGASPDGAPAKVARKKRIFKEDEYDKDDDFVDDSEMLWEEKAAASRDGFFVYSGPLVPEEDKLDEESAPTTKRGRANRTSRTGTSKTTSARASGAKGQSTARSTTTARKPRATKQEKEQRERDKAENGKPNQTAVTKSMTNGTTNDIAAAILPSSMEIDG